VVTTTTSSSTDYSSKDEKEGDSKGQQQLYNDEHNVVEVISGHERIWVEQPLNYQTTTTAAPKNTTRRRSSASDGAIIDDTSPHDDNHCDITQTDEKDNCHLPKCHEGIMLSAKRLVDKIQDQIEHWCIQRGYQLVLCGHSLGAGCASLAAILLRSRLPELTHTSPNNERPRMHVYCFAPPPVLDKETALAASSYCTSIVNNADMIPRCSVENLLIFLEILKGIWKELLQQKLAPVSAKSAAVFFRKIAQGTEGDLLLEAPAARALMREAREVIQSKQLSITNVQEESINGEDVEESKERKNGNCDDSSIAGGGLKDTRPCRRRIHPTPLYIPGVVLLAYEPWQESSLHTTRVGDGVTEQMDQETETVEMGDSNLNAFSFEMIPSRMSWRVTDGTAAALRYFEMDASSRMAVDHATTSYFAILGLEYKF